MLTPNKAGKDKAIKDKAIKEKPVKEKALKEKPQKQKSAKESLDEYNQSRQQKKSLFGRKTQEKNEPEINKNQVSLDSVKPGEPLPNPLKGPAPSNKTKIGFDFEGDDGDDFAPTKAYQSHLLLIH